MMSYVSEFLLARVTFIQQKRGRTALQEKKGETRTKEGRNSCNGNESTQESLLFLGKWREMRTLGT